MEAMLAVTAIQTAVYELKLLKLESLHCIRGLTQI